MEFSFFIGLCFGGIGSFAALKTWHKREVVKLKKYFSSQQESYAEELQTQVNSYQQIFQDQQQQHTALLTDLQRQLTQETQKKAELQQQLSQEQELNRIQKKKLRESNQDIDEILESLEQSQQEVLAAKDQEIAALASQNKDLAINLEQLKVELFTLKQQGQTTVNHHGSSAREHLSAEQITELLEALFPDIILLRDSVNILAEHPENLVKLIKAIKDIYDGHPYSPTKVRATDRKWTECRVPHINLMRIYFQKCKKESGYQILISPKKNQKSQDQDYEWLKSHQAC